MESKIKIIVAERNELFLKSLTHLLKEDHHLEIVDEVKTGKELIEKLKNRMADVVILEIDTREINCYSTIDILKSRFPSVRIIVLGELISDKFIADLMSKGVNGFVCVDCAVNDLFTAIQSVHTEGYYFDHSASGAIMRGIRNERENSGSFDVKFNDREIDVMKGICDGKSNREIGEILNLSPSTVDFYRSRLYTKTNCKNIASIIKYALQHGIVSYA